MARLIDTAYTPALLLKTNLKRECKQYDHAWYYCDKMISVNHQFLYMLNIQARILFQQKNSKQGLERALANYQLNRYV